MKYLVSVALQKQGFEIIVNKKKHVVEYPQLIWDSFPKNLRLAFAELTAVIVTIHFSFSENNSIKYFFPVPQGFPFFMYSLLLAMPENTLDFKNSLKTTDYICFALNSHYRISFSGTAREIFDSKIVYKPDMKKALVPFTFGKDSLLTYALCKELDITPVPFFFLEPSNMYENKLKQSLMKKFSKEFGVSVQTFKVPFAELKQNHGLWWGWDVFLAQYTLYLIPFMFYYKAGYLFWSNEFNCSEYILDEEKFCVSATTEQSGRYMQILNTLLRNFGSNAQLRSLLEPLTEVSVLALLHFYHPELGKYQASCINDHPVSANKRWCGKCYECARVYVLLRGLGINPDVVELYDNMLLASKKGLFYLFPNNMGEKDVHSKFKFATNEKLLVFYLAYRRGNKGKLINEFVKQFLPIAEKNFLTWKRQYFSPQQSLTIPVNLEKILYSQYEKKLHHIRKLL